MNTLTISGLEGGASTVSVTAQYNPKELGVEQVIAWRAVKWDGPSYDSVAAASRTMSFELMFDGIESGTPIEETVAALHKLSDVDAKLKRPPKVKVAWGAAGAPGMMPPFEGIIDSLGCTYTMFQEDGTPVRATISLKLIAARKAVARKRSRRRS
jgi:hypothetical protein